MKSRSSVFLSALPIVGLLCLYLLSRIHALITVPPFIDELGHIGLAQDTLNGHWLTGAGHGKLIIPWWFASLQTYGDAGLWIARVGVILAGLISVSVMYSLGRYFTSHGGGLLAAALFILTPYLFFFDRMALFDQHVTAFGLLVTWFSVRYVRRRRIADAILCGLLLVALVGAKATGIMLTPIPALAILLLVSPTERRDQWRGLIAVYGAATVVGGPLFLLLRLRGWNYLSVAADVIGTRQMANLPERMAANIADLLQIDVVYLSLPFALIIVGLAFYLIIRRPRLGLFLSLSMLIPVIGLLVFSASVRPRYFVFHIPLLLLVFAVGLFALARDSHRYPLQAAAGAALAAWAVFFALPFHFTLYRDVAAAPLAAADRYEYVSADSAGYSLDEIAAFLQQEANQSGKPLLIVGLIANCDGLAFFLRDQQRLRLECPTITHTGSEQSNLAALVNERAGGADYNLWLAVENLPYATLEGVTAPYEQIRIFDRPGNITHITLYKVSQTP